MRNIIKCLLPACLLITCLAGCDDQNYLHQKYLDQGEAVYPGIPSDLTAISGNEKVKFTWALNADPRIVRSVIYWNDGEKDDSLSVNVTSMDLQEAVVTIKEGTYEFKLITMDELGHKSMSVTRTVQVFGPKYFSTLSPRDIVSSTMQATGDLRINWWETPPDNLLYTFVTYTDYSNDPNGVLTTTDTIYTEMMSTTLTGYKRVKPFTINSIYQIGVDTVWISDTETHQPAIAEDILAFNGITETTDAALLEVKKLSFPLSLEGWTFGCLSYFPNLEELDLTPGTETLPEYTYTGNGVSCTVGGGPWLHFVSGFMSANDKTILETLLRSGQLKKVKYTRYSYTGHNNQQQPLDYILEQYSDKVEWVPAEPVSDQALMIPPNLLLDYRVAESDKGATVVHSEDGSIVPAAVAAKFDGELKNVYKVTITGSNSTIAFSTPQGTQFSFVPYGSLQFDSYIETTDPDYGWLKSGISQYAAWNTIYRWRECSLEQFPESNKYSGNHARENALSWTIATTTDVKDEDGTVIGQENGTELGTWKSHAWGLVTVPQEHRMIIRLQFGLDGLWPLPAGESLTYYLANVRWVR